VQLGRCLRARRKVYEKYVDFRGVLFYRKCMLPITTQHEPNIYNKNWCLDIGVTRILSGGALFSQKKLTTFF